MKKSDFAWFEPGTSSAGKLWIVGIIHKENLEKKSIEKKILEKKILEKGVCEIISLFHTPLLIIPNTIISKL